MKKIYLFPLILLIVGCSAAKIKPPVPPAVTPLSADVRLDPITDARAILKYDRGEGIQADGQKKSEEAMTGFCNARKYKILVDGERISGEKKWTRIIVFECIEEQVTGDKRQTASDGS